MTENLLHFIWQNGLYGKAAQYTSKGEKLEIIAQGIPNFDSGPDFTAAKIKIGEILWSGNIEIHVKSSDWYRHNHHKDRAYNNVILHVVYQIDKEVLVENRIIPQLQINFPDHLLQNYHNLMNRDTPIACNENITTVNSLEWNFWLEKLLIERMKRKYEWILKHLTHLKNDWNETFYYLLARNLGFKTNALPFEMLSQSLSYKIIAKHRDHIQQVEALLFGQAGFLTENIDNDAYFTNLKKEYRFLAQKYSLKPLEKSIWKFARMRPSNFPSIRLAQFAQLIHKQENLFSKIIETKSNSEVNELFTIQVSSYWKTHYRFGKETTPREHPFGKQSQNLIIINTVVPILFAYGMRIGKEAYKNISLDLLTQTPVEKNRVIENFTPYLKQQESAYQSQALIQLYNEYCSKHLCEKCIVGQKMILNKQTKPNV